MEQPTYNQLRQTAYIVQAKDIVNGVLVKEDGWNPNYIKIGNTNVSRVNLIGVVIDNISMNNLQTITIDDGSERISLKEFDKKIEVSVGDIILVVGKIREYNKAKYIAPEVIKKGIDAKWSIVWKNKCIKNDDALIEENELKEIEIVKPHAHQNYTEKIISKIREYDDGNGAPYETIINEFSDRKTISELIENGDVFEIKPGRLKVLD